MASSEAYCGSVAAVVGILVGPDPRTTSSRRFGQLAFKLVVTKISNS